ncbi:hypothetical protein NEUTE1DRAFT_101783 [Neurospora tetrasperma FGSC 2508]|uniref:Uncharacterized protein n=1 Tax=Neurospora tetrasperma (strain FGSC 2508 / ATCC MYA-4615 / P0657) TaxID=510951 RepID=F8MQ74_NEUT8|nr:uncharacterized protein NEUTE1DRAFT_101783 [Neurospora tetrasperma FGSC 2508]EGO56504.1 hypothetical protein NEUTE1DRAFT_101783 [Neurospora tetrasperma FGSC 2508]EGZ70627.1 hypothetical protein NEUTE2DRAFT_130634 [Neurospora tetrasperma FGSC 2509]
MGGTTEYESAFWAANTTFPTNSNLGSVMARYGHCCRHQTELASKRRTVYDNWRPMHPNARVWLGCVHHLSYRYILHSDHQRQLACIGWTTAAKANRFASNGLLGGIPRLFPSLWMPLALGQPANGYNGRTGLGNTEGSKRSRLDS